MSTVVSYDDVVNYVDKAGILAESVRNDISKGNKVSTATVLALSEFIAASKALSTVAEFVEKQKQRVQ